MPRMVGVPAAGRAVRLPLTVFVRSAVSVFEGDADGVERLLTWSRTGPTRARVDGVEIHDEPAEGFGAFQIR